MLHGETETPQLYVRTGRLHTQTPALGTRCPWWKRLSKRSKDFSPQHHGSEFTVLPGPQIGSSNNKTRFTVQVEPLSEPQGCSVGLPIYSLIRDEGARANTSIILPKVKLVGCLKAEVLSRKRSLPPLTVLMLQM